MASEMKIEYINPFLVAATSVLSNVCGVKLSAGKPYVKTTSFDESSVVISLGVTGQVSGQVLEKRQHKAKSEDRCQHIQHRCPQQIPDAQKIGAGLHALADYSEITANGKHLHGVKYRKQD